MVQFPNSWKAECADFGGHDTDWPVVRKASGTCQCMICIETLSEVENLFMQNNDLGLKKKYRPAVKFQNIDVNVLRTVQSGDTAPNDSELDMDGGIDSDDELAKVWDIHMQLTSRDFCDSPN